MTIDLHDDTPESLAWQEERSAKAAEALAALPAREALGSRVTANLSDTRLAPLSRRGDRWFQSAVVDPGADQPVIVVRDSPTGTPRVLLDANELTAKRGAPVQAMLSYPSPDGSTLAVLLMEAGKEQMELQLIDVQTGERLPDEIPWNIENLAWHADSKSLWLATRAVIDGALESPLYQYVIGQPAGPAIVAPKGISSARPVASADGRHVAIASGNTEPRLDWLVVDGALQPFLKDLPGGFAGRFVGDDLIAIVDHEAPRGRLVRIPVATAADPSTWTELVAESEEVVRWIEVVGDVLVLGYLRDAAAGVRLLDLDGSLIEELDVAPGTVSAHPYGASHPGLPMLVTGDDEISFIHSSFNTSWATYRYVVSERRLELVTPPSIRHDDWVVSVIKAPSTGGVEVPAHVVHRADVDTSVPQPTLLHGYGGFNLAELPSFNAEYASWIEAGGVYVLAHLRGGSEYGSAWWRGGQRDVKQHTFDDLYAVAEELLRTGVTTIAQLGFKGESNGGLLAGAAVVQRPDLWSAVVADVPILDLLGMVRDPLTYVIGKDEYGDPLIPEEAAWLERLSPVHNVKPANYPSVLVSAGANDPRCPTWHSRVFVDLLEQNQQGDAPILLRVYADQGHGAAGMTQASSKSADWLAFVANATGLAV
jgi:prolyl oligopeptidase